MVYIINLGFFAVLVAHGYGKEAYLTPDGRRALLLCVSMFVVNAIPAIWSIAKAAYKASKE